VNEQAILHDIRPGMRVRVRGRNDVWLGGCRALSGVIERRRTWPIVYICREEEWQAAKREGREPEDYGWPAADVEPDRELTPPTNTEWDHSEDPVA
jgi:hypothetical protein